MRIIILGAGEVGFHLAKNLTQAEHDIVVVDNDPKKIAKVNDTLDVLSIPGDATSPIVLEQAGIRSADILIAVTSIDEVNLMACLMARKYGVKTNIARLRRSEYSSPDFILSPQEMGVDLIIHPELQAAEEIVDMIRYPQAFDMHRFEDGKILLVGLYIGDESPVIGKKLSEIVPAIGRLSFRAVAIYRQGRTIIPSGKDLVMKGDKMYVAALEEHLDEVFMFAGGGRKEVRNVMILGGGKIGRLVAAKLEMMKNFNIKLIESNKEKSQIIAEQLKGTMVVQGDGTDLDLLAQEGIIDMDAFVAVTDDDENNIVSSLVVRHMKVPRTITLVRKSEYMPIVKTIGLDVAVNKRLITSNAILKFLKRGPILSFATLRGIDADTIEFEIPHRCKWADMQLRDIKFPQGCLVGAVSHNGNVSVPVGDTILFEGDHVVIFVVPEAVKELEKMFSIK
ncbi:Trk system potassium transporter TrkA [bacterium]|nr:Trk system potassium transporter TrkA [bacterium]